MVIFCKRIVKSKKKYKPRWGTQLQQSATTAAGLLWIVLPFSSTTGLR